MKRALVLSGGGAKGAFQLGALEYIAHHKPSYFDFQIIAGVSVGSLNGVMLAQKKFEILKQIWDNVSNEQIYTGSIPRGILQYILLVIKILFGRRSILGIKPLISQIEKHVNVADVATDFRCGFVSLVSGEYVPCNHLSFGSDNENFRKAILASSTMPVIWEPVDEIKIGTEAFQGSVDGGVRNVSPLKDVINDQPDEIIVINCNTKSIDPQPDSAKNIFKIAGRALTDITINEIFRDDIEEFVKTNSIVKQCADQDVVIYRDAEKTEPYLYFNSIIIEPLTSLGDPLDFSKESVEKRRRLGYDAAEAAFKKYDTPAAMKTARSYKPEA